MHPRVFARTTVLLASLSLLSACRAESTSRETPAVGGAAGASEEANGGARDDGTTAVAGAGLGDPEAPDDEFPVPAARGLAPTPPMGWSSWNKFGCNITAEDIREIADAMVETGMNDAGYRYVNIDDCWAKKVRDAEGNVQPTEDFPDGIKAVADYLHDKGLALGVYSDRGTQTCAGRAGSEDYEAQDAQAYADWGVDYLKYDNCFADEDPTIQEQQYETMAEALLATGRPIVYSLCAWAFHEWGTRLGQLWRTTSDIKDDWDSMLANALNNSSHAAYAGPNGFNDPDMLEIGNGGMTDAMYEAHMSLWAIMAAPLIAGNDLRSMTAAEREILTNEEVIAVDQDALGLQGVAVRTQGDTSVWVKPLNESGARAVVLLNAGASTQDMAIEASELGLRAGNITVRDLWQHEDLGSFETYQARVAPQSAVMLKVQGKEPRLPSGTVYLSELPWTYAANHLGPVERDMSNGASAAGDGKPISLRSHPYERGLGVGAGSLVLFRLGKACSRFTADIGVDDETNGRGSVAFQVWADGEKLYESGVLKGDSDVESIDVSVKGKHKLRLLVTNGGDGAAWDRASWADAKVECGG